MTCPVILSSNIEQSWGNLSRGGVFMLCRMLVIAAFMNISMWSCAQVGPNVNRRLVAPLRPLLEALDRARVSGSLELSGHCDAGRLPHFPHLRSLSASRGSVLQDVREMLADDPAMQVMQDPEGTIRMTDKGVSADLLNVKIAHVSFESNGVPSQSAAFSPNAALMHAILRAPEAATFLKAHGIILAFGEGVTGGNAPRPVALPHIVGSMDDLTVSQALDRVLGTFPGIWFYETCPQSDGTSLFVRFFSLRDPGLAWE